MNRRLLIATAVLATGVTAPACLSSPAHAAGNCGGQNATPQPVPYTCNLPGIDLTVQGITRHFSAVVNADGTRVTVQFIMTGGTLPVAVPIRIVHHEGISGAGGSENESQGTIPAGQTTATLTDSAPCRDGQLDVKAVFIANGQSQGRVGGPWIQNGTGCNATTTVPQSSTTLPVSSTVPPSPTTTPASTVPSTVGSTAPASPPQSGGGGGTHSTQIPATGRDASPLILASAVLVGLGLVVLEVRRRSA